MSPREAQTLRTRLELYRSLLQREGAVEPLAALVELLESELQPDGGEPPRRPALPRRWRS